MISLLMVGNDSPGSLEVCYTKHLVQHPDVSHVSIFPSRRLFFENQKSLSNKLLFKIGYAAIYKTINQYLLQECTLGKYNYILVFKGMEIFPKTLMKLKSQGIKLVNLNPDNPFHFSGKGSGNSNIINSLQLYDLHITYSNSILEKFGELGITARLIPFGFSETATVHAKLPETMKVCFIGYADKRRIQFINKLATLGTQIDVFGPKWTSAYLHKNISAHDAIVGQAYQQMIPNYRIQLNLLRPHNANAHNMRSFEIPAYGGIQLANNSNDHKKFFIENQNIFLFENAVECVDKINYLLSLPPQDAEKIRVSAKQHCAKHQYGYYFRANELVSILKELQ